MIETILTVPPRMAEYLNTPEGEELRARMTWPRGAPVFATSDPKGLKLGSGGGTVHALWRAWLESGEEDLDRWLASSKKLILHAGGQSRRLPAYAAVGKAFLPLPPLEALPAQRFDQMLCDFQVPPYSETLVEAGEGAAAMVTSGDVWLDFNPLDVPTIAADIAGIGMRVPPEVAEHFGVYFVRRHGRSAEREVAFLLQKPSPDEIRSHLREHDFFVDTGMWLLSVRAVKFLFRECGWSGSRTFPGKGGMPGYLDLYGEIGPGLGRLPDGLTSSVIPLEKAAFYHLESAAFRIGVRDREGRRGRAEDVPQRDARGALLQRVAPSALGRFRRGPDRGAWGERPHRDPSRRGRALRSGISLRRCRPGGREAVLPASLSSRRPGAGSGGWGR